MFYNAGGRKREVLGIAIPSDYSAGCGGDLFSLTLPARILGARACAQNCTVDFAQNLWNSVANFEVPEFDYAFAFSGARKLLYTNCGTSHRLILLVDPVVAGITVGTFSAYNEVCKASVRAHACGAFGPIEPVMGT